MITDAWGSALSAGAWDPGLPAPGSGRRKRAPGSGTQDGTQPGERRMAGKRRSANPDPAPGFRLWGPGVPDDGAEVVVVVVVAPRPFGRAGPLPVVARRVASRHAAWHRGYDGTEPESVSASLSLGSGAGPRPGAGRDAAVPVPDTNGAGGHGGPNGARDSGV